MKQVHDSLTKQTLLEIENLRKKYLIIEQMKQQFSHSELVNSFESNYQSVKN